MKKAQILSAIALAFALGLTVVAPVANTYAETRASVTTPEATATDAEVEAVINSIEAQPEYKAYAALKDALATTASDNTLDGLQATIAEKIQAVTGKAYDGENTLDATIAAAKATPDYDKWATLVAATTDTSKDTSEVQKIEAIKNAAAALNLNVTLGENEGLTQLQDAVEANTDYKKYEPLVTAVNGAEARKTAVDTAIDDLENALAGVKVDARDIATAAEGATPITSLKALAPTGTRVTNYNALIGKVADTKEALESPDNTEVANATAIVALKDAYKLASGSDLATTPTTPGEGDNKPADGEGEDQNQGTVNPGDTGVVSSADGTASSTVAIVAGIATALTAAGAGVVAYRNARRAGKEA